MNNDLISRRALFKAWNALDETQDPNLLVDAMIKATQEATAVDAEPVRHGWWTEDGLCADCGYDALFLMDSRIQVRTRWCPNCGAKMDGDNDA